MEAVLNGETRPVTRGKQQAVPATGERLFRQVAWCPWCDRSTLLLDVGIGPRQCPCGAEYGE